MSSSGQQVRVRFVTEYDEFRVVDSPFAVPAKLGRHGLSEVVNHLLELSVHQPFDFLIQGKLVRVPLSKFLATNRLSSEEIIVIEYFPAASLSDESDNIDAPSWVGAIDSTSNMVVSGCYNGQLKVYDIVTLAEVGSIQAHDDPIRAIRCWETVPAVDTGKKQNKNCGSGVQWVASASKDNSVKVWSGPAVNLQHVATLVGHMSSVESLGRWESKDRLLSGDWAGNLYVWDLAALAQQGQGAAKADSTAAGAKKRRKNSEGDVTAAAAGPVELKPLFTIKAHGQCLSGVSDVDSTGTVLTCSWDHSLKAWDLERQDCTATLACSKVFTSLHRCGVESGAGSSAVLTSHPDGKVRLWDLRPGQAETGSAAASFGKTAQWISQVRWQPGSAHVFAATDYAGTVTLWDTRSPNVPLGRSEAHGGKALCLHWLSQGAGAAEGLRLLSGGSDCCIKVTAVGSAAGQKDEETMDE